MPILIPYYKINKFFNKWALCGGADGCEIVHQASLGNERPPPLPPKPKSPAVVAKRDPAMKMLNDVIRFKNWLNASSPPKTEPVICENKEMVPPFDIQEIPDAMHKLNMPVGEKLWNVGFPENSITRPMIGQKTRDSTRTASPTRRP